MSGNTLKIQKQKKNIRDKLEVTPIEDQMRETRLRWFW